MPSENIIIRNCHFKGLHAVVIGSEMSAGVRNVFIENCDYAGYCKRGIYIKTNPDRGGFVRDIYVNNCVFDEVEDLFYITSMYAGEGAESKHFSSVENIFVDGVRCQKARQGGIVLQGTKAKPLRNISFRTSSSRIVISGERPACRVKLLQRIIFSSKTKEVIKARTDISQSQSLKVIITLHSTLYTLH